MFQPKIAKIALLVIVLGVVTEAIAHLLPFLRTWHKNY